MQRLQQEYTIVENNLPNCDSRYHIISKRVESTRVHTMDQHMTVNLSPDELKFPRISILYQINCLSPPALPRA